jgi:hypothetical protein
VSSDSGWIKHAGGIGRLIELRGPERHQARPNRDIFEGNRANIALECWIKKKRCYLEQPSWKTVPWALEPESKDSMSYLQDILCDMPGLMEDAMSLRSPGLEASQKVALFLALSENVLDYRRQLYVWRTRWEEENPISYHKTPAQGHADEQLPFQTMLYFSSVKQADQILLYNIALIFLSELGTQVTYQILDVSTPGLRWPSISDPGPLCLPGDVKSPCAIAIEICECVRYYISDYRNRAGFCLLKALRATYTAFPQTSDQAKWLNTILEKVVDLNGLDVSKTLNAVE